MNEKILIEKLRKKRLSPSKNVRYIILGLTPGRQQHIAIDSSSHPRSGAFKGYMRSQMYDWFQLIGLSNYAGIENKDSLFEDSKFYDLLYTTSLLREPVYLIKNGVKKNYSGRAPKPWQNEELLNLMKQTLSLLETLDPGCLIIPLGQIVSEAVEKFSNLDKKHFVMHGFPHPSGANAGRGKQFTENLQSLKKIFLAFKKNNKG